MPRCSDVPKVLREVGPLPLAKRILHEVADDHLFAWAAAMAYAWLFAFFPFLVFLLTLLPYLPNDAKASVNEQIVIFIYDWLPWQSADLVWNNVKDIIEHKRTGLLSVGAVLMIWGASGGMNTSITALERCYEIDRGRPFYKKRPLAVGLTLVVAVLILSLLVLLPVGSFFFRWLDAHGHPYLSKPVLWVGNFLRYPVAALLMFTVLNVLYHFGPSIRQRFVFITPGALFAVVVWWLLALSFRFYVHHFGKYNETYGTVGGVAILLLFFYLDAAVLLIGAEINSEIDYHVLNVKRGSRDFTRSRKPDPDSPTQAPAEHSAEHPALLPSPSGPPQRDGA